MLLLMVLAVAVKFLTLTFKGSAEYSAAIAVCISGGNLKNFCNCDFGSLCGVNFIWFLISMYI